MPDKECGSIMEKLDNNPLWGKDRDVMEHIKKCPDCYRYSAVTSRLNRLEENRKKPDLWHEFLDKLETRGKTMAWIRPALAAVSLMIIAGLFFTFFRTGPVPNNNQTNAMVSNSAQSSGKSGAVNTEYNYDTSDLDYYYEISMEI